MNKTTSERHTDIEQRLVDIQRDLDNQHEPPVDDGDAAINTGNETRRPDNDPYYGSLLEVAARTRRLGPPPIDPNLPIWSQVLNAILDHGGVTPNDLGDRLGVSRQAVYAWQVGKIADMGTNRLGEIAEALGVPAYLFLTDPETAKRWIDEEYYGSTPSPWNAHNSAQLREVGEQLAKVANLSIRRGVSDDDLEGVIDPGLHSAWVAYCEQFSADEDLRRAS